MIWPWTRPRPAFSGEHKVAIPKSPSSGPPLTSKGIPMPTLTSIENRVREDPLPEGWEAVPFEDGWHDIHGGTIGRWATPWGEVALKDDDDGRGYLTATTTARDMIAGTWKEEE